MVTESYMEDSGRPLRILEKVRANYELAFHGVCLNLGSTDRLNAGSLARLKGLINRFQPAIVSDHCCWTGVDGENLHECMPLPYTEEALNHVATRVLQAQEALGRRILIENISSPMEFIHGTMTEWEFLGELCRRADCGLLLDINSIYINSVNHGFDATAFLKAMPRERVGQIHLAGHSRTEAGDGQTYLINSHDQPICDEVWALYARACALFPDVSTAVERDGNIPEFSELAAEVMKAKSIHEEIHGERRPPAQPQRPTATAAL